MASMPPPLPIMPSNSGAPRPTGMLAMNSQASISNPGDAISHAVTNFLQMKEAMKAQHKNKFMEGVQAAAQGIPVDYEAIMKHAKKAGMDWLPTDAPSKEEQAAQAQLNVQRAATQPSPVPGVGQQGVDQGMASLLQQTPQGPQAPSTGQKILQGLGAGSQTQPSMSSPMGQWLSSLSQAGQMGGGMVGRLGRENVLQNLTDHLKEKGVDVQSMTQDQQMQFMGLVKKAIVGGDPEATENLVRLGLFKDIPLDEYTAAMRRITPELPPDEIGKRAASAYMYAKLGGPQLKLAQMTMAKDMLPFLGNDMGKSMQYINDIFTQGGSNIQPGMSPEQYKQYMEGVSTLTKAYPTAPMNLINATAHAQLMGNQSLTGSLMDILKDHPREGTVDLKKHSDILGYDYATLAQKTQNEAGLLNLATAAELGKNNQQAYDNWFKLATNKELDPTGDATRAAFQGMADAMGKDSQLKINYRGQEIPIGAGEVQAMSNWRPTWPGGKPFLAPAQVPGNVMSGFTGVPGVSLQDQLKSASSSDIAPIIQKYAQQNMGSPDANTRVQALVSVIETLSKMPPTTRSLLVKSMDVPPDMKKALGDALAQMK